jgi:O-antigen/teichoic acid export membrane protein
MTDVGPPPHPDAPTAGAAAPPQGARAAVGAGIRWGLIDQTVQVVVRLGTAVALARLIAPKEFGVFGLAVIVLNFGLVLSGLGLGSALVQRRDLTTQHVTTAFTTSAAFGVVLAGLMAASAIPASEFFNEPRLRTLLPVLGVTFVLRGLELTPNDMLTRAMRFRSYYISSTIATIASSLAALAVGIAGGGVAALVTMMLVESALACILAWMFAMREGVWRPSIGFHRRALGDLIGFSAYVTAGGLVSYANGNGDNLVIGRVLGATALGYYALAYRIMLLPLQRFGEIMSASAFPALASVQHDLKRLRIGYLEAMRIVSAVCFPVTIGIAVTAPVAIPLVLGERWRPATVPLQILALAGPLLSINRLTATLARSIGRANWSFWLDLLGLVVYVPAFLIGVQFGLEGVAVAFLVAAAIMTVPELRIVTRALQLGPGAVIAPVVPIAAATATMAAAAHLLLVGLAGAGDAVALTAAVVGGAAAYTLVLWRAAPELTGEALRLIRQQAKR